MQLYFRDNQAVFVVCDVKYSLAGLLNFTKGSLTPCVFTS